MRPRLQTAPGIGESTDTPSPSSSQLTWEDVEFMVKSRVTETAGVVLAESKAESKRLVRELEQRDEDLERKLAEASAAAQGRPVAAFAAARPQSVAPANPWPSAPAAAAPVHAAIALPGGMSVQAADQAAANLRLDGALDGRRRRKRLVALVVVSLVTFFGGLFVMLAQSYLPRAPEVPEDPGAKLLAPQPPP